MASAIICKKLIKMNNVTIFKFVCHLLNSVMIHLFVFQCLLMCVATVFAVKLKGLWMSTGKK